MLSLGMDFARRLALANQAYSSPIAHSPMPIVLFGREDWTSEDSRHLPEDGPAWAPAIMMVDEIDLHLHPTWQQRVLEDLMRAFPCTQFIVTTHSPQVISTVRRENIRILETDAEGRITVREPYRNPYAHSNSAALEGVMGGSAYPASPILEKLREYQRLVGADQHDSARAKELRAALEAEWGRADHELALVDITMRKNEALRAVRAKRQATS